MYAEKLWYCCKTAKQPVGSWPQRWCKLQGVQDLSYADWIHMNQATSQSTVLTSVVHFRTVLGLQNISCVCGGVGVGGSWSQDTKSQKKKTDRCQQITTAMQHMQQDLLGPSQNSYFTEVTEVWQSPK